MESVRQLEGLVKSAMEAAEEIRSYPGTLRVVSHYDADGIASAAIVVKALERQGKTFRLSFVKQLSEELVRELAQEDGMMFVFTDLGSGFLREISEHLLPGGRKVVILDHHQVQGEVPRESGRLFHVNPVLNGIEEDISGSGVSYLMARALSPVNKDLSEIAIIGAIGDSQTGSLGPHWGVLGTNKEILKDAQSTGKIRLEKGLRLWGRYGRPIHKALQYSMDPYIPEVSGSESGSVQLLKELGIELKEPTGEWRTLASLDKEETRKLATGIIKERIKNGEDNPEWIFGDVYELLDKEGSFRDANEFATMLNACGKSGNAWMGVGLCLNDPGCAKDVKKVMSSYRREIGKAVDLVRKKGMVRATEKADYIMAGSRISEHVISNVASIIEKSCLVPEGACRKPVFALADADDGQIKVSGRASDELVREGLSIKDIMACVAEEIGGQGGGHAGAGGATIPKGSEERFINTVEKLLSAQLTKQEAAQDSPAATGIHENPEPVTGNNIKEEAHKIEKQHLPATAGGKAMHAGPTGPNGEEHMRATESLDGEVVTAGDKSRLIGERVTAGHLGPDGREYGRIDEGTGAQGKGKGREEEGQAGKGSPETEEGVRPAGKEMERQGLVRYLFS